MANAAALIQESLWRNNPDFRRLPRTAQCTFVQLCSTRDLDCAGQLTVHIDLLAKACDEITVEDLWHDLKSLEVARFIFVDTDTDEMLIRSYVRLVSARSPNAYRSALKAAKMINSPKLRVELAKELRRLGKADASVTADEIMPDETPSESHLDPIETPSRSDIPSEPHREPPVSVPVLGHLSSCGGQVGRGAPPNPYCQKHPNGTERPCGGCKLAKDARADWDAETKRLDKKRLADFWDEVRACDDCDPYGRLEDGNELAGRCKNHDWSVIANA